VPVESCEWDGVGVIPRQRGSAVSPSWITVDWVPTFYGWSSYGPDSINARHDSSIELAKIFEENTLAAIDSASNGALTSITRNSHVFSNIVTAVINPMAASGIVNQLHEFVVKDTVLGYEFEEGVRASAWLRCLTNVNDIAEIDSVL